MAWNEQLLNARKEVKLKQREVAEAVGLTLRSYQRIEAGIQWPSYETLAAICKTVGLKAIYFFS